jgi:restriction system protein
MSFEFYVFCTVIFAFVTGFIGIASSGDLQPEIILTIMLSPVIGPLAGWLFVDLPLSKRSEARRVAQLPLMKQAVTALVKEHKSALSRNLTKALTINDFGAVSRDQRHAVWSSFFSSTGIDTERFPELHAHASAALTKLEVAERRSKFNALALPSNGHEFELWVTEALRKFGWKASATPQSGDQGIDVIAERNGRKLGIQCKLYSGNVGNKAVQEAYAGKIYYALDDAAVLTNSKFTPAAKSLAASTGIHLLSQFDISTLHQKLMGYK